MHVACILILLAAVPILYVLQVVRHPALAFSSMNRQHVPLSFFPLIKRDLYQTLIGSGIGWLYRAAGAV